MADTLIFLDIKAIPGDSVIQGFENQIELQSASWGMSAKHTRKGTSQVTTDLRPDQLTITKYFDKASVNLYQYMAQRKMFVKAVLTYVDIQIDTSVREAVKVMEVALVGNCYIEDIRLQASESGNSMAVKETMKISFRELSMTYYPLAKDSMTARGKAQTFVCVMPFSDN
jgi:type VI protein secretion system component Hcp